MAHPHPNPLGKKEGLLGRVAPYAGVALLGTALIPLMDLTADTPFVVAICAVTIAIVSIGSEDALVVIEVKNTGVYVPPEDRERLFERFFRRSDPSAQDVQGVGLGLTIAQSIVQAHRGTIEAHSTEDLGTTFRVELPLPGRAGSPNAGDREEIAA